MSVYYIGVERRNIAHIDRGPLWYTATSEVKVNASPAATVMVSVALPVAPTLHLIPEVSKMSIIHRNKAYLRSFDVKSVTGEL